MNELEFICRQVSMERGHAAAVRGACATALAADADGPPDVEFLDACAGYLVFTGGRFDAQDLQHDALLRPCLAAAGVAEPAPLDGLLQSLPASREAIGRLAAALEARHAGTATDAGRAADARFVEALRDYLAFHAGVLAARRHSLHDLCDRHYGLTEWRRAAAVDADSILEERERYARVVARLPDGLSLAPSEPSAPALRAAAAGSTADARVGAAAQDHR
ncbi:MAG: hypothetical protein IT481_15575 [Gammaproteobacteria bacterium]|nr:hypothetical protein [Gammaproteobacteria bacterium]